MVDYLGYILNEALLMAKQDKIIFSGNVAQGSRDLLVIDETTNKIVSTGKSAQDGSYSTICMPDRWEDDENGAICPKVVGIAV